MITKSTRFLIIGLGLIGGSYAMGLSKKGYHVDAIDINELSIDYAKEHEFIQNGSTFDIQLIKNADIIISALYPEAMIHWFSTYQKYFKKDVFLTDVSGVKCNIIDHIQLILRDDVEFCASHPMAGKEVSGVTYADNTIFKDANFIITPTKLNTNKAIETLKQFATILEFKNISILSCEEHDKMIGFLSQLTHAIAVSLMNTTDNHNLAKYTGDSFRDLTRIAKINENLWSELFFLNKDNLISEIDAFIYQIKKIKTMLETNNEDGLKELFIQSTIRRKRFD